MVKATKNYFDKELKKKINKGEVFEVSEKRASALVAAGMVIITDKKEKPETKPEDK